MDSSTHDGDGHGDDDIVVRDHQTKMKNNAFKNYDDIGENSWCF